MSSFDFSVAEAYHSRCNTQLIPLLDYEHYVASEDLLATVVILREYEEMSGKISNTFLAVNRSNKVPVVITGKDHGYHLVGVSAMFNVPDCAHREGLGQAAFWQFVRQDIYMSLPKREPPRTSILNLDPVSNKKTAADCQWANRMVWETASTLALCFGDEPAKPEVYQEHVQRLDRWFQEKPLSFTPFFYRNRSPERGRYFPEIWLADPWHGR